MKKSNRILHFDNLDLLGIGIALSLISCFSYVVMFMTIFYLWKIRKKVSWILYLFIFCMIVFRFVMYDQKSIPDNIDEEAWVTKVESYDTYDRLTVKINHNKYMIFTDKDIYQIGDKLMIKASVSLFPKQTVPHGFNAKNYYLSKGVFGKLEIESIRKIGYQTHLLALRDRILSFYQEKGISDYALLMLFGGSIEKQDEQSFESLGLIYILSISGIHLYALGSVLKKIFFKLNIPQFVQTYIILGVYAVFLYLHCFDISVFRVFLMTLFMHFNRIFEWRRSKLELIHIVFIFLILFQIESLYSIGLLMMYLIITGIALLEPLYRNKHSVTKRFVIGWIVLAIIIPFQNQLNLISLFIVPLVGHLMAFLLMIGSIIIMIFPKLNFIFQKTIDIILEAMKYVSQYEYPMIYGKHNSLWILIYFLIILAFLITRSKLRKTMLIIFLMVYIFIPYLICNNETSVTFLDVGQGDSTVLRSKGCVAVIDAFQGITDYLENRGIHKIDYLFLTHSDFDHIKESEELMSKIDVRKIVLSQTDQGYPNYTKKVYRTKSNDSFTCGNLQLDILNPFSQITSSNDSSIVIQTNINHQTFLFMGDLEETMEHKLVDIYGSKLKSDILKIGHHGSNTSTSLRFLIAVNPSVAIISVGRENRYGFPDKNVLERLNKYNIKILRTDLHGTISYLADEKKSKWQLHLPF